MLIAIAIFLIVLSPVLIPAFVTGCHGFANWRGRHQQAGRTIIGRAVVSPAV
jgi:hypothetical protein